MKDPMFIDGFSQIHFYAGMVRINTYTFQPQGGEKPGQEAPHADAGQLVMSPQAFVGILNAMQKMAGKLADAGLLKLEKPNEGADAAPRALSAPKDA